MKFNTTFQSLAIEPTTTTRINSSIKGIASVAFLLIQLALSAQPKIQLQQFASGFSQPVDITHCGDSRLFVVEQKGFIRIIDSLGNKQTTPFLDIDARVNSSGGEQGLLGLAFHPDYQNNGYFYVNYTRSNGDTRISRFSMMAGDTSIADPNSEAIMIDIAQPYSNHNGGCMKFGPDGYLYISEGDGGSGGDPENNGQKKTTMLGKMLRIDVNEPAAPYYKAPADNPFVNDANYLPEIWSLGLRNVWRFSFDRLTGDMWIADVGQNIREEINFEPANTGGRNYGWRCYEASLTYNTAGCQPASNYTTPVFEYVHNAANGCSVTGGFIYRGTQYADLYGKYIFPDYCSGRWWYITPDGAGNFNAQVLANLSAYEYSSLGEDRNGELYACGHSTGRIYKIRELCSGFSLSGAVTDATCASLSDGVIALSVAGGATPYSIAWTANGGNATTRSNLAPGQYIVAVQDANQCMRRDTFNVGEINPVAGLPEISFTGNVTALCDGDPVTLKSSPGPDNTFIYAWSKDGSPIPGASDSLLIVNEAGVYAVSWLSSVTGCQSDPATGISIVNEISPTWGLLYSNGIIQPDEPVIGQWFFNGTEIPGAFDSTYTPVESGYYSIQVTSTNGCAFSIGINVTVSGTTLPAFVLQFDLTPNPTSTFIQANIQLQKPQPAIIQLVNASGKLVFEKNMDSDRANLSFSLSDLPAGNYYCCLKTQSGIVARKVVKL